MDYANCRALRKRFASPDPQPWVKHLRIAANVGEARFCNLAGTEILRADLQELSRASVVRWVRQQTMMCSARVVLGCSVLDESVTFLELHDGCLLNVLFETRRLPILELEVLPLHASLSHDSSTRTQRCVMDLAHVHAAGQTMKHLHSTIDHLLAGSPAGRDLPYLGEKRWKLEHEGRTIFRSDSLRHPYDVFLTSRLDDWVAQWQTACPYECCSTIAGSGVLEKPRLPVTLRFVQPIIRISLRASEEQHVIDLEEVGLSTGRQLLEHVCSLLSYDSRQQLHQLVLVPAHHDSQLEFDDASQIAYEHSTASSNCISDSDPDRDMPLSLVRSICNNMLFIACATPSPTWTMGVGDTDEAMPKRRRVEYGIDDLTSSSSNAMNCDAFT